jgi:hypothetical protein
MRMLLTPSFFAASPVVIQSIFQYYIDLERIFKQFLLTYLYRSRYSLSQRHECSWQHTHTGSFAMRIGFQFNRSEFEVAFTLRSLLHLSARVYVHIPGTFGLAVHQDSLPARLDIWRVGDGLEARIGRTTIVCDLPIILENIPFTAPKAKLEPKAKRKALKSKSTPKAKGKGKGKSGNGSRRMVLAL